MNYLHVAPWLHSYSTEIHPPYCCPEYAYKMEIGHFSHLTLQYFPFTSEKKNQDLF